VARFFSPDRHGRRPLPADRFDHALSIAHRWFLDQVGDVAVIQYVTAPADMNWWRKDDVAPLIAGGIGASGQVALTLHRKFIELKYPDDGLLPERLYELLITEWAALTGKTVSEVDPEF